MILQTILPLQQEDVAGKPVTLANDIVGRVQSCNPQTGSAHIYIDPLFDKNVVKLLNVKIKISSKSSKK